MENADIKGSLTHNNDFLNGHHLLSAPQLRQPGSRRNFDSTPSEKIQTLCLNLRSRPSFQAYTRLYTINLDSHLDYQPEWFHLRPSLTSSPAFHRNSHSIVHCSWKIRGLRVLLDDPLLSAASRGALLFGRQCTCRIHRRSPFLFYFGGTGSAHGQLFFFGDAGVLTPLSIPQLRLLK